MPYMRHPPSSGLWTCTLSLALAGLLHAAAARAQAPPFEPAFAQPGKDVVWVPTPAETVELMLDVAGVTADDVVLDLGSGDGRMVIAAAGRGATARGVEYNPDMVRLSRAEAVRAGVAARATFVEGDMYQADVSQATVLALFLLPENLRKLTPAFLGMAPGSRIVLNTFAIPDWPPDARTTREAGCASWCTVLLHVVPAQVSGVWALEGSNIALAQRFQEVTGTIAAGSSVQALEDVTLRGARIAFSVGDTRYQGRVSGETMSGLATSAGAGTARAWTARRQAGA